MSPPSKRHKSDNDDDQPSFNRALTFQTRKKIDDAAQKNDRLEAFAAYDAAKNDRSIVLPIHTLNVLLHLCSSSKTKDDGQNEDGDDVNERLEDQNDKQRAEEIFYEVLEQRTDVKKTEMSFTAMARLYARLNENEKSFEMVHLCKNGDGKKSGQKLTPKLRTFTPSLHGFAKSGNVARAEDIFEAIEKEGLECTEIEFTAMMDLYGREKETCEEKGLKMLRKMKTKVRTCGKELIESIKRFFEAEPNAWRCETIENVESNSGRFETTSTGEHNKKEFQLKPVGLDEVESKELIASVGKLAREREAGANFDEFCNWLKKREAKVQCIIDGANVGMANQNFAGAKFHFGQLDNVVDECRRRYCMTSSNKENGTSEASKQRPVVFLHQRRTQDKAAKHQFGEKILTKLRQNKEIFVTPHGSNDDWYWLYAALVAGENAVLISNDEMRDHVFQMLPDPNLLRRWKERHQVRFSVTKGEVEFYEPAVFTTCIQEDEKDGYWMIPFVEDEEEEEEGNEEDEDEKWLFCCKKQ